MTFKELFDKINETAKKQPSINDIIKSGNIYDLNSDRNTKFAVFCASQGTHNAVITGATTTYNFILYYVDRLKSDESNKIQVQSTGIETIKNILRVLSEDDEVEVGDCAFNNFTESFSEVCAGTYATVSITVYDDGCVERF